MLLETDVRKNPETAWGWESVAHGSRPGRDVRGQDDWPDYTTRACVRVPSRFRVGRSTLKRFRFDRAVSRFVAVGSVVLSRSSPPFCRDRVRRSRSLSPAAIDRERVDASGRVGTRREQARDAIQVLEVDDLDGRVHVPVRDRDGERRDPAAGGGERVGVRPGSRPRRLELDVDPGVGRGVAREVDENGVVRAAAADDGTGPQLDRSPAFAVDVGVVGGVGHVDGDERVHRVEVDADHPGALEADLLLNRGDGVDGGVDVAFGGAAEPLGGRPRAGSVVDPPRGDPVAHEFLHLGRERDWVADLDVLAGLLGVGRADVDELAGDLVVLVLRGVAQVDRGLADHALHGLVGVDGDVLPLRDGAVGAADPGDPEEAVVEHVADDEADLVGVARQRDRGGLGGALVDGDSVAVGVDGDLVGEAADVVGPDPLARRLEAGGAGGGEQIVEERSL